MAKTSAASAASSDESTVRQFEVLSDSYINDAIVPGGSTINLDVPDDFVPGHNLKQVGGKPLNAPAPAPVVPVYDPAA